MTRTQGSIQKSHPLLEESAMALQGRDKPFGRLGGLKHRREERSSVPFDQTHAFVLLQDPTGTLVCQVTRCQAADGSCALDQTLGGSCDAQFEPIGLSLGRIVRSAPAAG